MKPTADVEELAGHEIAFERGQKEHGADQVVFHLRALDAALLSANFSYSGSTLRPSVTTKPDLRCSRKSEEYFSMRH
jgi:hypothetical protein